MNNEGEIKVPVFIDEADRAAFYTLPEGQRDRVMLLAPFMIRLRIWMGTSRHLSTPLRALLRANPTVAEKFSIATLRRLFDGWRSSHGDWRTLIDRRRIPFA